ncbi:alanine dehydrogenase [Erysipelotrichaceae bacterium OttesenSCG-928-M19]|nr:alanine dehydrogenase [Erysipelotrichaceae bacterium OttesenSCG-928-M19]
MRIGLPKEIKPNENRVGLTPAGVQALIKAKHSVFVESDAGVGSGIEDESYQEVGATIVYSTAEAWDVDMVVKVKEPLESEYQYFKENMILFTYLHLAANPELTQALLDAKVSAIAYETVQLKDKSLPLLSPMSEIAGRRAPVIAANFLEKQYGGMGILLSGVPGTERAHVVVVGAGVAGLNAAKIADGMGARVTILDVNLPRLKYIDDTSPNIQTLYSNEENLYNCIQTADVLISTVLIPGSRAPKLVKEYMVKDMQPGSVIIDVAIDQGGSVETIDKVTTLDDPIFTKYGVIHYSVANMPGAVPNSSTFALTNATQPYVIALANKGLKACLKDKALLKGVNLINGAITYESVAQTMDFELKDAKEEITNFLAI